MDYKPDKLVDSIIESYGKHDITARLSENRLVNRKTLISLVRELQKILFPGFFNESKMRGEYLSYIVGNAIEEIQFNLQKQIAHAFINAGCDEEDYDDINEKAADITYRFLEKIPEIREMLYTDVLAFREGDPAAYSMDEIIFSYPGLFAIMVYRCAHELWILKVPLIPRIMSEYAHNLTGIDIHPGAKIGRYFFIDHGTGIVIGETTEIGEHVRIYQGVTLGALSTRGGQKLQGIKRHPTIGDNVTIYSNASILGGETVIGSGSTIAGNTFITSSVPENCTVSAEQPNIVIKTRDKT